MRRIKLSILLFTTVMIYGCPAKQAHEEALRKIKALTVKGIVVYKGELPNPYPCFGNIVIKDANGLDTIETCHCATGSDLWDFITVGDSCIKPLSITKITIRKASGDSIKIFEYPSCYY